MNEELVAQRGSRPNAATARRRRRRRWRLWGRTDAEGMLIGRTPSSGGSEVGYAERPSVRPSSFYSPHFANPGFSVDYHIISGHHKRPPPSRSQPLLVGDAVAVAMVQAP